MIKNWSKFNENSEISLDDLRNKLSENLMNVREIFVDLEDMGIVSYTSVASGNETGAYSIFDPKRGDFEKFLDYITPTIKLRIDRVDLSNKNKTSNKDICIIVDIKIPSEKSSGNSLLAEEGIEIFDDFLSATSRLKSLGYDIRLDLNSNHVNYKPARFLIYFDI